jgi:AAA domain
MTLDAFEPELADDIDRLSTPRPLGERGGKSKTRNPAPKATTITADVLAAMTFAPLRFAVPELLPEGLALLAGAPKLGKSYLAMDLSIAIGNGGVALGSIPVEQGDVLYCALEDSERRLNDRLHKLTPHGFDFPKRLYFKTTLPRLEQGCIEELEGWLDEHPGARLIILDTWRCVKPESTGRGSQYDEDANAVNPLHALTKAHPGLAVLILHHTRKLASDDPYETISGTNGLMGVPDTLMVLAKHGESAKLTGHGRDVGDYEKALNRAATGGWIMAGDARELAKTGERQAIIDVMIEAEGETLTAGTIARAVGKKSDTISHLLKRLVADGQIEKAGYGKYRLAPPSNYSNRSNWMDDKPDSDDGLNGLNGLTGGGRAKNVQAITS